MDINKNKSIRKGFIFSKTKFPIVLTLSNGLFINLFGCTTSQVKNGVVEAVGKSSNNSDHPEQSRELPKLPIDNECYKKITEHDSPSLKYYKIKAYEVYERLCTEIRGFSKVNPCNYKYLISLSVALKKLIAIREKECEVLKREVNEFVTFSCNMLDSIKDPRMKRSELYDTYKKYYKETYGDDAEHDVDIIKDPKLLLGAIENLKEFRLKKLDSLMDGMNEFLNQINNVLKSIGTLKENTKKSQDVIMDYMTRLSTFYVMVLVRDWSPNPSTDPEPNPKKKLNLFNLRK